MVGMTGNPAAAAHPAFCPGGSLTGHQALKAGQAPNYSTTTCPATRFVISSKCYDGETAKRSVLKRFRAAVVERVVLYGSRARGDHKPDSDYDVAVVLKGPGTLTEGSCIGSGASASRP